MFRIALCLVFSIASIPHSHYLLAQDGTFGGANKREPSGRPPQAAAMSSGKAPVESVASSQKLLAPLAEDEQFFSAPDNNKTVASATQKRPSTDGNRPQIRLLGIGRVGKLETNETHAILRIADQQLYLRIGDSFGEIEVVDIGGRSVTLQSGRERWTIELFEQPIVNTTAEAKSPSATTRRKSTQQGRRSSVTSSAPKLVSIEPTMPSPQSPQSPPGSPTDPVLDVPKAPDLELPPAPPDLPDFSNVR